MKRVISLCLATIIISLSFASCGKNPMEQNDTEDQNGSTNEQVTQITEGTPILATDDALSKLEEMLGYFLSPSVDFDINEPDVETKITGYLLSKITHYRSLIDYYELYYQKSMDYYDDYTLVSVTYKEEDIAGIMFDVFGLEPSKKPSPGTWTYDADTNTYSENFLDTGYIFQDVTITDTQEDDGYYSFEVKSKEYLNTNKKYAGIRYYSVKAVLCFLNGEQQWRLLGVTPLDKEPTEKDKALLAYANYMIETYLDSDDYGSEKNSFRFSLIYIDDDEIPELTVALSSIHIEPATLFFYDGEEVVKVDEFGSSGYLEYIPRGNKILSSYYGFFGITMHSVYNYYNGKATLLMSLNSELKNQTLTGDNTDDFNYYINDKEVSYEEYTESIDLEEFVASESDTVNMTYDEIRKM